jgi:hypothetical protein
MVLAEAEELDRMLAAGLKGPVPVTADGIIARIYRDTTPDGKRENHWRINPLPPPAFYERITELFRAFELERKAKGWPEFICCPIDEVDPSCKEFGVKVYAAVKAAGLRTYATKDPIGADAADYAPYLDIWCSQPYSVPYERIVAQDRHEYWCYPNHNAGEIKDRLTMCKGGRMTYGFGLWRSGYTTLIPWHWCWTAGPDPFDYLRGRNSGCGQRVDDDGEVMPAIYWACFREGYDDGRYVYTLQQAIVEREHSKNPGCLAAVAEGRRLLQETWDTILVQSRYLADGMWPSEEFDTIRWRLAVTTARLLEYPVADTAVAPSVWSPRVRAKAAPEISPYETAKRAGKLETFDLGGGFDGWKNGTAEGKTEITEAARHAGKIGLRWTVAIDHQNDGGEGGKYPVGWPRVAREFKPGELDLSGYDTLELWIRVDSNRDEVTDDHTPIGVVISSHEKKTALYETTVDLGANSACGSSAPPREADDGKAAAERSLGSQSVGCRSTSPRTITRMAHGLCLTWMRYRFCGSRRRCSRVWRPPHVLLPAGHWHSVSMCWGRCVSRGATKSRPGWRPPMARCAEAQQDLAESHRMALAIRYQAR